MPLSTELLNPISIEKPGGENVRYSTIYDRIKEARREDDELSQGDWRRERKTADWPAVINLASDALATRSKDLQLAVWLTEALVKQRGYEGLLDGLILCRELINQYWDHLYPELEDSDAEMRAAPLQWLNRLDVAIKRVPVVSGGYDWLDYKASRTVAYESEESTYEEKNAREKQISEGKQPPEVLDKAFSATPKAFYRDADRTLTELKATIADFEKLCDEKFGEFAPSFAHLAGAIQEVAQTIKLLLNKKREMEPDAPEELAAAPSIVAEESAAAQASVVVRSSSVSAYSGGRVMLDLPAIASEPVERRDAIASIIGAATFLRKHEPQNPAPYLMLRGLRWGELRAAVEAGNPMAFEPPPTELRSGVKALALTRNWNELLETAEAAMGLPCSRAWLDLQRWVVKACEALGPAYATIAEAIRFELVALLRQIPQLVDATLMDDTPAANPETRAWLRGLLGEPEATALPEARLNGWPKKPVDAADRAALEMAAGQEAAAIELLQTELAAQVSGRARFQRRLQLVQLLVSAGKEAVAQPLLDDIAADLDTHKLENWEDPNMVASAMLTLIKWNARIREDATEKQKLFERICRLDPVAALNC